MSNFLKVNGTVLKNNYGSGTIVNLCGTNLGSWMLREDWMSPLGTTDEYTMRRTLSSRFNENGMQDLINNYEDMWFQISDLQNIKNLGLNVLRVPMYWENFMDLNGVMKPDSITFRKLDWLVMQAKILNIYIIPDLHGMPGNACPWQSGGRDGHNELWTNTTYQKWTVQIWQRLANYYKGNATIAAYDLMNEPLLTMGNGENPDQVKQKMDFYNVLYKAVRLIDPDHIIMIAAFYWWWAATPPSTYGWSNVVYQTHHYQTTNYDDWNLTNTAITEWLRDLSLYQKNWNVPVFAGEYSIGQNDLFEKWLSGLNAINASWCNWTYKVKGDKNWGFYYNNYNPSPDLNNDNQTTIITKWSKFTTNNFMTNTGLCELVKKHSFVNQLPTPTPTPIPTKIMYSIKALSNAMYISAEDSGNKQLVANRTVVGDWEKFQIINNSDNTISLLAKANNKFLQVDMNNGSRIIAGAQIASTWEKFYLIKLSNGQSALKSLINNNFVSVNLHDKSLLYANGKIADNWESLVIQKLV